MENIATIGHNNPPTEKEILQQRLDSHEDIQKHIANLGNTAADADTITTDEDAGYLTDNIKALKAARSTIGDIFKREKAPFFECCKIADAWKNDNWAEIDGYIKMSSVHVLQWNKKKEEEERQRQFEIAKIAREEAEALAAQAEAHAAEGIDDTAEELMDAAIQEETKADMISDNALHGVVGRSRGANSTSSAKKVWVGSMDSRAALDLNALRNYFTEAEINKAIKAAIRDGVREIRGANIYQEDKLTVR